MYCTCFNCTFLNYQGHQVIIGHGMQEIKLIVFIFYYGELNYYILLLFCLFYAQHVLLILFNSKKYQTIMGEYEGEKS